MTGRATISKAKAASNIDRVRMGGDDSSAPCGPHGVVGKSPFNTLCVFRRPFPPLSEPLAIHEQPARAR